ncbi:Uncharacterised protein [Bordetella pertussis]|nr:Uncharacterised protein [Bordetella pertussis]CFO07419.1 Uncharacterised protein [Bordetella pertussis]CFO69201.1 Uncharacterised protein [Bordetella pertussis]CFP62613.1 Uncharacterised protein [Bordetella pertussis]CFU81458.1 Uncharacterised protein [Bordetella pertussis]
MSMAPLKSRPGYQVAPNVLGEANVCPRGVMMVQEKSSVSFTNAECAVRMSVCAMLSAAATQ